MKPEIDERKVVEVRMRSSAPELANRAFYIVQDVLVRNIPDEVIIVLILERS